MTPTHEDLLEGRVYTRSIINEPPDFVVNFEVEPKDALERARLRWRCEPKLIEEQKCQTDGQDL